MFGLDGIDHTRTGRIAARLIGQKETIAISESSAGGLISAALLTVPGASAYFLGGGVIYTRAAMGALLALTPDKLDGIRSATEPMAALLAETVRGRLAPIGASLRRARPAPTATDMGTLRAMPALPSRASGSRTAHWRPGRAIGSPTWRRSRMRRLNYWRKLCSERIDHTPRITN